MMSIVFQHKFTYGDTIKAVSTSEKHPSPQLAAQEYGYTAHTMAFPVMNVRNALTNLAGVVGGLAPLAGGAQALLYSATTLANLTGTIQALWAATLISFGFCIPLLVEALNHPLGSVWKWFSVRCRYYPPDSLPIQLLNSAILNLTLALPISSLMYRHKLPVGAQFRSYEVPVCAAMALVLLLPPLCRYKLKRGQGAVCLALYFCVSGRRVVAAKSRGVKDVCFCCRKLVAEGSRPLPTIPLSRGSVGSGLDRSVPAYHCDTQ